MAPASTYLFLSLSAHLLMWHLPLPVVVCSPPHVRLYLPLPVVVCSPHVAPASTYLFLSLSAHLLIWHLPLPTYSCRCLLTSCGTCLYLPLPVVVCSPPHMAPASTYFFLSLSAHLMWHLPLPTSSCRCLLTSSYGTCLYLLFPVIVCSPPHVVRLYLPLPVIVCSPPHVVRLYLPLPVVVCSPPHVAPASTYLFLSASAHLLMCYASTYLFLSSVYLLIWHLPLPTSSCRCLLTSSYGTCLYLLLPVVVCSPHVAPASTYLFLSLSAHLLIWHLPLPTFSCHCLLTSSCGTPLPTSSCRCLLTASCGTPLPTSSCRCHVAPASTYLFLLSAHLMWHLPLPTSSCRCLLTSSCGTYLFLSLSAHLMWHLPLPTSSYWRLLTSSCVTPLPTSSCRLFTSSYGTCLYLPLPVVVCLPPHVTPASTYLFLLSAHLLM